MRLRKKYSIKEEYDPKNNYDIFITNIIDIKSEYPIEAMNIFKKIFRKLDKYYFRDEGLNINNTGVYK